MNTDMDSMDSPETKKYKKAIPFSSALYGPGKYTLFHRTVRKKYTATAPSLDITANFMCRIPLMTLNSDRCALRVFGYIGQGSSKKVHSSWIIDLNKP